MQGNWYKGGWRAGRDLEAKQFEKCGVKLTQLGRDSILAQKKKRMRNCHKDALQHNAAKLP